jgi:PAS domain S-box-containing protein
MNSGAVRILHLEDDPLDAELIASILADDGLVCQFHRAATGAEFVAALDGDYDLIISDYSLPAFDGITAQRLAGERRPDLPFVFVSGTMGEEVAIERLNAGATDYVLKQRLGRLPRAVRRALKEAQNRLRRTRAEAEVRRLNAELEGRVEERTRQLATANAELAAREMELQKSKAFLASIVENVPAVLFVKDAATRRYVRFNRAGEELLGLSRDQVVGKTDEDLFPPHVAADFTHTDSDLLLGAIPFIARDHVIATPHGPRFLHTEKRPIADTSGRPAYLLGISLDITDRREAEEQAGQARLEADRANRAKSHFLSRMSHDFRTPLNAIMGFAQLLELDEGLTVEQLDNVSHIRKGGLHLLELVNEVLDISRIETGQLSLSMEPVRVADVLRNVAELLRPLAESRRITVSVDDADHHDCHALADSPRLGQVLVNLVGNAVKYSYEGDSVRVTVARQNGRIRIRVSDSGPGIPDAKRALLFRPFERLGAEQGPVEGTGLGLALAKGLMEAMNGAIGIEDTMLGATFWIELVEAADTSEHVSTERSDAVSPRSPGRGTVLYIEDNKSNVRLLERLLSHRPDVRLLTAATGTEGFSRAVRESPGLILLDMHLPDLSGDQILDRLSRDRRSRDIPVVILSADATRLQAERMLEAGARAYLTKPLVLSSLLATIDEHLAPGEDVV